MKSDRVPLIDRESSFHGKTTTALIYVVIIALTIAALYFEPDYMAHVPLRIGICSLDSTTSSCMLESFASFIREKGGGDIEWIYFDDREELSGCDFYFLSPIKLHPYLHDGEMELVLFATTAEGNLLSRGAVVTRKDTGRDEISAGKVIFSGRYSPSGFLSPYYALVQAGYPIDGALEKIDFAGPVESEERVIFGVLFGEYAAGGMSLDRFRAHEAKGSFSKGELVVRYTGLPVVDLVVASASGMEHWKRKGFTDRLPDIASMTSGVLRKQLNEAGISSFVLPGDRPPGFFENFPDSILVGIIDYHP